MATSRDKFKVHCLRNGSFEFQITLRTHTYIPLFGSGGAARWWQMFSVRGGVPCPIPTINSLLRFCHDFLMPLTQKRRSEMSKYFQDTWHSWWSWCWLRLQTGEVPLEHEAVRAVFLHYKLMGTRQGQYQKTRTYTYTCKTLTFGPWCPNEVSNSM